MPIVRWETAITFFKKPEGNLQRAMRHPGGLYAQRYKRLKKTDGSLFHDRYKAILVDHDAHMVERLEDYKWSSYPSYIGEHKPAKWLHQKESQGTLGEIINEASHLATQALRPTICRIVTVISDYYRIPERDIYQAKKGRGTRNRPRKLAVVLAQQKGVYRLTEIAEAFGLQHYSGVSNAIYDVRQAIINNGSLRKEIKPIINRFDP